MSAKTQREFHPDAESLNAFVEQALGRRERAEVLAHLAVCVRCRQVAMLASEAAGAGIAAATVAPTARRAWRSHWWIAAIPAAALAATAALTVYVHVRNVERLAEVAKVEPQSEARNAPASPPRADGKTATPTPPASAKTPSSGKMPAPPTGAQRSKEHEAASREQTPHVARDRAPVETVPEISPTEDQAMANPAGAPEGDSSAARSRHGAEYYRPPPPAPTAPPRAGLAGAVGSEAPADHVDRPAPQMAEERQRIEQKRQEEAANRRSMAAREAAPLEGEGVQANAAAPAAAPAPQPRPMPPASRPRIAEFESAASMAKVASIHLPGGLDAVSIASAGHRELAIDRAGTLFISDDAGGLWERVTPQWTGRAIMVRRHFDSSDAPQSAPAAQAETSGNSSADSGLAPSHTGFFELFNDKDQMWLSTDGRTWAAK
jgi:Putative zinc-finger